MRTPVPALAIALFCLLPFPAGAVEPLRGVDGAGVRVVVVEEGLLPLAGQVAELVPELIATQAGALDVARPEKVTVALLGRLPANPGHRALLGLSGMPPWAAGMARSGRNLIIVRLDRVGAYPDRNLASVLAHEVAHLMLDHALGPNRATEAPAWFDEGFAMSEAYRFSWTDRYHLGRTFLFLGLIPLERLERRWPDDASMARAAYAQTFAFMSWVLDRAGEDAAREVVRLMARGERFRLAWREATGRGPEQWEKSWRRSVSLRYRWIPVLTSGGTLWFVVSVLFVLAVARKRRRARQTLERWDDEERFLDTGGPPS